MSVFARYIADEWMKPITEMIGEKNWTGIDAILAQIGYREMNTVTVAVLRTAYPVREKLTGWAALLDRAKAKMDAKHLRGLEET